LGSSKTKKVNTSVAPGKETKLIKWRNDINDNNEELNKLTSNNLYGRKVNIVEEKIGNKDNVTIVNSSEKFYDIDLFKEWSTTVKGYGNKATNKKVSSKNYYQILSEVEEEDDKKEVIMLEVEPIEYVVPSFNVPMPTTANQRSPDSKEEKTWKTIVSKEKLREFQATHETISHRYLPKIIVQITEEDNK
jgi:hypothetical protein